MTLKELIAARDAAWQEYVQQSIEYEQRLKQEQQQRLMQTPQPDWNRAVAMAEQPPTGLFPFLYNLRRTIFPNPALPDLNPPKLNSHSSASSPSREAVDSSDDESDSE